MVSQVKMVQQRRIKTYVEGLDEKIGGGIREGHIILIFGSPGTMKSTLCLNILWNNSTKENKKCLYITLEEEKESLIESMRELGFWPYQEEKLVISDIAGLRLEHAEADKGRDWFRILEDYIKKRYDEHGLDILVIDSLNAIFSLDKIDNPRRQLFHFFGFIRKLGITAFIISELHPGGEEISAYGEDFLADGTFALKFHQMGEADYQLRIRCMKLRHSKVDHGYMALIFRDGMFSATPPISE
jgi:KaiC/GvpD/RAD55 family RecA-like ATPase